jgi:DNA-directed RNA polymerase specialized sigma24 family protein
VVMLITQPAATYDEISAALAMPVGSIGPTRARAIARLRGLLRCSAYFGRTSAGLTY